MPTINGKIYSRTSQSNLDAKYGPYESVEEAFEVLATDGDNAVGLTVGIINPGTGDIDDYWFYGGNSREHLVAKLKYDGSTLIVNGRAWQLQLSRPTCQRPSMSLVYNTLSMSSPTPGAGVLYAISRYDEDSDSYPELPELTLLNGTLYNGPIEVVEGDKFKIVAVSVKEGWLNSERQTVVEVVPNGISYGTPVCQDVVEYQPTPELDDNTVLGGTASISDNGRIDF